MKMNIWEILRRAGLSVIGILMSSLFLASVCWLALGWEFRMGWGIFLLVSTGITALVLEYGNYIPKIPARIIAGIFLGLALYTIWPGLPYIIARTTGKTTAKSYTEYQAYNDLRVGEAGRPKSLQGREVLYAYKLKREAEIREQLQKDLDLIAISGGLYSEEELQKMETQATEAYNRRIAELNKLQTQEPAVIKIQRLEALGIPSSAVVLGVLAAIATLGYWLWKKEKKDGTISAGATSASSNGKKRMRPGLIILASAGYIIYFWAQYAILRYWIVEWTGFSPSLVTLILTVQQIIIIGILYYLVEPLMPEAGKVRYAFILISIFGALNLYIGYVAYPYEFFDFKTGESRFWVSDDEDEIYYASGYSKLYGTPLRQGTKEDAIKYKSQIDSSVLASPFKQLKSLKIPKIFGEKPPALEPYAGKFDSLKTNIVLEESLSPRAPFDRKYDLPRVIKKGDIIAVEVSGNYIWDPAADGYIGPCGASWTPKQLHYKAKFPILEYGIAGVVLKIGDGGYVGLCESGQRTFDDRGKVLATFRALEDSGSLTVAINERWDSSAYSDNSGNISVRAWLIN